ncbi:putative: similar to ankyrin repeat and death domain containing 1A, partial [Candida maltosa Xu316]
MKVGKNQELLVDFKTPNTKFNWKFNNYPANDLQDIEKLKFKYYYEKGISLEETNKEWELIKRELKLDTAIKTEYFLKILGFFMNDGSLKYDDPDTNNCTSIEFRHVERRYPVYIARCLDKLELKKRYDWSAELLDDGLYKDIQIRSGIWCILFSKWFGHAKCVDKVKFILQLNQRESQWVLDGLFRGDETATYITGSSEEFGNFFTMVALNAGYSTYMTCSSSSPQYRHEDNIISHQEYNSLSDSQKSCFVKTTKTGNSWRLFCGAKDKKNYNSQHPIDGAEITSKLTLCPLWSLKNSTGYTIVRSVKKDGKSKIIKYNKPFIAPVFKTPRI